MELLELIMEEGLPVVAGLLIIGAVIKHTDVLDNKWIPLTLLGISLVFTPWLLGGWTAENIIQAVLVTGTAVYGNQLVKQLRKDE